MQVKLIAHVLMETQPEANAKLLGAIQIVYFSPEDLDLVRGEPGTRREFLDRLLITRTPRLAGVIADYERVVKQRNALLKTRTSAAASRAME